MSEVSATEQESVPASRARVAAGALLCWITIALFALPGRSLATAPELQAQWNATAQSYVKGEPGARDRLLALASQQVPEDLSPFLRILLGDAYLRAGSARSASQQFDAVLESESGDPWRGLAALGRGWVATTQGQLAEARDYFDIGTSAPGNNGLVAAYMGGMVDAARG